MIDLQVVKYWTLFVLKGIVLVLAFLFILSKCNSCEHKTLQLSNNDSLHSVIKAYKNTLKQLDTKLITANEKSDSLLKLKKKVEVKYIASSSSVRNDLNHGICDTVKIIETLNDCDSIISLDNKVIATKDTIINYQTNYISIQKAIISTKDAEISNKDNDIKLLKKEVKKQKRKTILAIIGGAITTISTIFLLK